MHGPTFMGNPLACAVASASLALIVKGDWQTQVANIENQFAERLPSFTAYRHVKDVRWLGAIGVIETRQPVNMSVIQTLFVELGVWIRPFGRLIYLMPPYISNAKDINSLLDAIEMAVQNDACFQLS